MRNARTLLALLLVTIFIAGCLPKGDEILVPLPLTSASPTLTPFVSIVSPIPTSLPVELFILPQDGVKPVLNVINSAQHSIHMVTYLLTAPPIIQALKDAITRGVDVRLILERNPYGGDAGTVAVSEDLTKAGVKLKWGNPAFNYTHSKVIVVDGRRMILMTGNLTSSAFSANREYGIIDSEPAHVAEVLRVFEADWERRNVELRDSLLVWAPDNARQRIRALLDSAKNSIDLEHQSCQDQEMLERLITAVKRGVVVRYLSSATYPLTDDLNEAGRERLRRSGAQVRYMNDPYIHAKIFVVDRQKAFIGSMNMTVNSLDFNREVGIVVSSQPLVERIQERFEADWASARDEALPTQTSETPPAGYIDHKDAQKFLYRDVVVQLTVTQLYNSGRVIWLMPDSDQRVNFKVVIFANDFSKWPESPDQYYYGKTIRVKGLIQLYRGWPEIVVSSPSQIEVVSR